MRLNADKHRDKDAIVFEGETITWEELWHRVQAASVLLSDRLTDKHQAVVAILAPNSPEFVIAYLAVVHAGHIAMPIDITFKKLEIDSVISSARPDLVIADDKLRHLVRGEVLQIEDLLQADPSPQDSKPELPPHKQIATIFLSSGTTGRPKLTPNTHSNILWDVKAIAGPMGWTVEDSLLITLHLAHRHGLVICLVGALYHGNTLYLEARFDPKKTLEVLESGKVSLYSAVPSIYESLVGVEPKSNFDLSPVRLFASSSSPLPPYLREAFERRFGRKILDRYGTSETGSIAVRLPDAEDEFSQLLEGVEVRLESQGEVALKSPGLFPGYYQDTQATRQNITADGWWLTGDIGQMRGDQLALKGRSQAQIIKSGYSIYPQDIEWALSQNPQIKEVSVVGLHSVDSINDKIVAFYAGSASRQSLEEYAQTNLPRSWRPDKYVCLSALPKGRTNKVQVAKLMEMAKRYA